MKCSAFLPLSISCSYDELVHLVKSSIGAKFDSYLPLLKEINRTRVVWVRETSLLYYEWILSPKITFAYLISVTFQECERKRNLFK